MGYVFEQLSTGKIESYEEQVFEGEEMFIPTRIDYETVSALESKEDYLISYGIN